MVFTSNGEQWYMSRGLKGSLSCLPEDMAVIIQFDRPFRFTTMAASVVCRHYSGQWGWVEVLRRDNLSRFSNWKEIIENSNF